VLPRTAAGSHMLLAADALVDADEQVRLAALLTASELPVSEAVANALASAALSEKLFADRWLPDALTSAAAAQDLAFLKAISAQKIEFANAAQITTFLTRIVEHAVRRDANNANALLALVTEQSPLFTEAALAGVSNGLPKNAGVKLDAAAAEALKKVMATATARRGCWWRSLRAWTAPSLHISRGNWPADPRHKSAMRRWVKANELPRRCVGWTSRKKTRSR
jgi:uncharacterized protein